MCLVCSTPACSGTVPGSEQQQQMDETVGQQMDVETAGQTSGTTAQPTLQRLPSSVLSLLVSQLPPAEVGVLRSTCTEVASGVEQVIDSVSLAVTDLQELSTLLSRLPGLKQLGFSAATELSTSYKCYGQLRAHVPHLTKALVPLSSLTSLTLSTAATQQLGALRWARLEAQNAVSAPGATYISACCGVGQQQPGPLDQVHWVPDWLAAPPNLQELVVQAPDGISSSSSKSSTRPVWLWLQSKAWGNKLTCLQLKGLPLTDTRSVPLQELTRLQRLCVSGCRLTPTAVEGLLQQLASCQHLTGLVLSNNGMWLLPKQGWSAVSGVKELDVSHNMLLELPAGLGELTRLTALHVHHNSLTALDKELTALGGLLHLSASHNWLSGCRATLPHLLGAWTQLQLLELDNVSDKRGELVLPAELAGCRHLKELSIRDNFSLDVSSLLDVLPSCKALKALRLSTSASVTQQCLADLRAVQPSCAVIVS